MKEISAEIREKLLALGEEKYADFTAKLTPTVPRESIIGVRLPIMRKLAKELAKDEQNLAFLEDLPHFYLEENTLHGLMIGKIKDFAQVMEYTEKFLPYVDNWATCDTFAPKIFKKHQAEVLTYIQQWLKSVHPYTVRFAVVTLMSNYLDEYFEEKMLDWLVKLKWEDYYVKMAIAWYFSTALVKQYEITIKVLEEKRLEKWVHNKSIQKALESYRIDEEKKAYLRTLKIK